MRQNIPEQIRSRAWAEAKRAALEAWQMGSADTTQMIIAASRAVDASLDAIPDGWTKVDGVWVQIKVSRRQRWVLN